MIDKAIEDCNLFYKLYITAAITAVRDYLYKPDGLEAKNKAYTYINAALEEYPQHCKRILAYVVFWELEKEHVDLVAEVLELHFDDLLEAANRLEEFDK